LVKPLKWMLTLLLLLCAFATLIGISAQAPVTAEAVGQANLRAAPNTESQLLGQIVAGTRYPIIGRSEFFPWYLLGDPATNQPLGWVFADLVSIQGDGNSVPLSTLDLSGATPLPVTPESTPAATSLTPLPVTAPVSTPIPVNAVMGTVLGEINIRYGPGVEYERIGVARAGDTLEITAWHTQLPWVQIRYPSSPNGQAWVAVDLLEIQGDLYSLPAITQTRLSLPTLTPTPPIIQQSTLPGFTPVSLSPEFTALANQLWDMMLAANFDPATSHFGALFLMNVETGEAISFGDEFAFSGMSINKIAILTEYYRQLDTRPGDEQAYTIAEAMVCSENISTNEMLAEIGAGNPYQGAERVSEFLQAFGAERSFIYTPYDNDPFITPQAPRTRTTSADQVSAEPDPYNQMTVSEVGALLNGVYQCGYGEDSALLQAFPDDFTPTECRQMLEVMSHNRIGSLIEMGVPEGVRVSHKHGWIDDTHGDAALVFSPGGAYILVVVLHNPVWLEFSESEPLIEEMSRTVYNAFNPDAPLAEVRPFDPAADADVATCNQNLFGSQIIEDLRAAEFDG
jgi:uncharacterized protein YraI